MIGKINLSAKEKKDAKTIVVDYKLDPKENGENKLLYALKEYFNQFELDATFKGQIFYLNNIVFYVSNLGINQTQSWTIFNISLENNDYDYVLLNKFLMLEENSLEGESFIVDKDKFQSILKKKKAEQNKDRFSYSRKSLNLNNSDLIKFSSSNDELIRKLKEMAGA